MNNVAAGFGSLHFSASFDFRFWRVRGARFEFDEASGVNVLCSVVRARIAKVKRTTGFTIKYGGYRAPTREAVNFGESYFSCGKNCVSLSLIFYEVPVFGFHFASTKKTSTQNNSVELSDCCILF